MFSRMANEGDSFVIGNSASRTITIDNPESKDELVMLPIKPTDFPLGSNYLGFF